MPSQLLSHLNELAVDLNAGDSMSPVLSGLINDLVSAIPSYAGLQLRIVHTGHPVVLTVFTNLDHTPVEASLRLPLVLTAAGVFEPGSVAVFWAHTPGAFIDLAADLTYVLNLAGRRPSASTTVDLTVDEQQTYPVDNDAAVELSMDQEPIVLDGDLPPHPLTSGVTGLSELSTINQAIGVLVDHGYEPSDAKLKVRRDAHTANQPVAHIAAQLLLEQRPQEHPF